MLRKALATKDYDKIQNAVETAEALDIRIAEARMRLHCACTLHTCADTRSRVNSWTLRARS